VGSGFTTSQNIKQKRRKCEIVKPDPESTIAPTLYGWIADQSNLIWAYRLAAIPLFTSFILFSALHFLEIKHDKAYKVKLSLST